MTRAAYIDTLDPDLIVERIRAGGWVIVTIQTYGDGYSWICHGCRTVGSDGEWTSSVDHTNELWNHTYKPGPLWRVQHDASFHASDKHPEPKESTP